jgi:hypothetical protein
MGWRHEQVGAVVKEPGLRDARPYPLGDRASCSRRRRSPSGPSAAAFQIALSHVMTHLRLCSAERFTISLLVVAQVHQQHTAQMTPSRTSGGGHDAPCPARSVPPAVQLDGIATDAGSVASRVLSPRDWYPVGGFNPFRARIARTITRTGSAHSRLPRAAARTVAAGAGRPPAGRVTLLDVVHAPPSQASTHERSTLEAHCPSPGPTVAANSGLSTTFRARCQRCATGVLLSRMRT